MKVSNISLSLLAILVLSACSEPSTPPAQRSPSAESQAALSSEPPQEVEPNSYEELEKSALAGDYQAQRNLAYTLTTSTPHNPILGCAWRIVIVESGSAQVDQSDTGNKQFDCDKKLNQDEINAAKAQAKELQKKIAKNDLTHHSSGTPNGAP